MAGGGGGVRVELTCPVALDAGSTSTAACSEAVLATFPPAVPLPPKPSDLPGPYFPISSFRRCWASLSASSAVCWPLMTEVKA